MKFNKPINKLLQLLDISSSWTDEKRTKKLFLSAVFMLLFLSVMSGCAAGHSGEQPVKPPSPSMSSNDVNGQSPAGSGKQMYNKDSAAPEVKKSVPEEAGSLKNKSPLEKEEASLPGDEKTAFNEPSQDIFQLHLTRDWGKEVLDSRNVKIKPDHDLLDYIEEEWQITAGAGGFITGINGLQSDNSGGNSYDWFFYVNGASSMVGAGQVKPGSGDVIYWDYHMWSNSSGIIEDDSSFPPKKKDS